MQSGKLKLIFHVAGANYGGVQLEEGQEFAYRIYVGSEGKIPFADPQRRRYHDHSGCCPWTMAEIIASGMRDRRVLGEGHPIDLFEAVRAIEAAIWQTYTLWKRGQDPVGHILVMCKIGRHRSHFVAISIW